MKKNTTQRSWSNYEGKNPIKAYFRQGPSGDFRGYEDSPTYAGKSTNYTQRSWNNYVEKPGVSDEEEGEEKKSPKRQKPKSLLASMNEMQSKESAWEKLQRQTDEEKRKRQAKESQWAKLQRESSLRA